VAVNAQQQFSAVVNGSSNQTVSWGVNGSPSGNSSVGFIDLNTGLYTAPNFVPSSPTVTVQATSQAMSSAVATASVTITGPPPPISVTISPASASVRVGRTKQFTATVQNSTNQTVTWSATAGTISASGLYRAPASLPSPNPVIVKAVSAADNTKSASAQVTITRR